MHITENEKNLLINPLDPGPDSNIFSELNEHEV